MNNSDRGLLESIISKYNHLLLNPNEKNTPCYILYGPEGKKVKNGLKQLIDSYISNSELVINTLQRIIMKDKEYMLKLNDEEFKDYCRKVEQYENIKKFLNNNYNLLLESSKTLIQTIPSLNMSNILKVKKNVEAQQFIISTEDDILCENVLNLYNSKIRENKKQFSKETINYIEKYISVCENRHILKSKIENKYNVLSSDNYNNIDFLYDVFKGKGNDNFGGRLERDVKNEIIECATKNIIIKEKKKVIIKNKIAQLKNGKYEII
ncbi:MAG: hypothetical protein PHN56_05360 [Candidatus Nanoarchaeia archaeon]|nr:hypothetical protein [Candidatus Nanoarchaeia archaeon]